MLRCIQADVQEHARIFSRTQARIGTNCELVFIDD